MSEWIRWDRKGMPVHESARVDVEMLDGRIEVNQRAGGYGWWPKSSAIVKYRVSANQSLEEAYEEVTRGINAYAEGLVDSASLQSKATNQSALDVQVDGDHYKQFEIQPVEFVNANNMDFLQGSVVKYISRHKLKGKQKDVEKAIHFCKLILELQYGQEGK